VCLETEKTNKTLLQQSLRQRWTEISKPPSRKELPAEEYNGVSVYEHHSLEWQRIYQGPASTAETRSPTKSNQFLLGMLSKSAKFNHYPTLTY